MSNASSAVMLKMPLVPSGAMKFPKKNRSKRLLERVLVFSFFALCAQPLFAAPFDYVANFSDNTVSVIDLSNNTVVPVTIPASGSTAASTGTAIPVGNSPIGVAINPAGTRVYVANFTDGTVSVIDTASNLVVATVTVGLEPQLLTVSADGSLLYVTNLQGNTLSVIDTATNTEKSKFNIGGYGVGIALNAAGTTAYVTLADQAKLAVVNTATDSVTTTVVVGTNPVGVTLNAAGTFAYVANYGSNTVSVIDTAKNAVIATIDVGNGPSAVTLSPDGAFLYVSNYISVTDSAGDSLPGTVAVIDTATNKVVTAMPVGFGPLGISINSTGTYAYVNNSLDSTISIIDLGTNVVDGSFTAGLSPNYSAITSSAALSVNLDQHGLTGTWYNPSTGGQGFPLESYPDVNGAGQGALSAGWFTFDVTAAGGQRWYTLQGKVSNTDPTAALTIYSSIGGNFNAAPAVGAAPVGQATLQFTDCIHGVLRYTFSDGSNRTGFIPLVRLSPSTTCSPSGDNGAAASSYLLSGAWSDPNLGGQGLIFDISPAQSLLSAAWYTYAPNGQTVGGGASQRWYTLQSNKFVAGVTSSLTGVPIYETTGGIFQDPTQVTTTAVGTANVSFKSCTVLTLDYAFTAGTNQGLSGTINLARTGPTPVGCSL